MKLIAHRRNTRHELDSTPTQYGIEVDIRSLGEQLIIHHDAFVHGESFGQWLEGYRHGTLILNVKEEGLEERLIDLLNVRGIDDFFFLDQSFPFLVKWANKGEKRCAVRVSEYESLQTALALSGRLDWIWVDCFTRFPLQNADANLLKRAGFKLCLVSPELQGRDPAKEIPELLHLLRDRGIDADAVCTKRPEVWEQALGSRR
jgi:hypothetical protein